MPEIPDRATVQMAKAKAVSNLLTGIATVAIKVPAGGRKISGGLGWFETPAVDDSVEIYVTDEDNLLGMGAGFVIAGYTDTGVPEGNRGWYIPHKAPYVEIQKLVEFGTLPENMYLKIVGRKGIPSADIFRVNLHWGK